MKKKTAVKTALQTLSPAVVPASGPTPPITKVDIGCGKNKAAGFSGMDRRAFPGVDIVHDVMVFPWPFADGSLDEVHCSHMLEHLDHNRHNPERVRFMNELYRVLKLGGKATIITPHWAHHRAYGDFTHADKPVSEMFYLYLNREWRVTQAPDNDIEWNPDGYKCDFAASWGTSIDVARFGSRNLEYQTYAIQNYRDANVDLIATLIKK